MYLSYIVEEPDIFTPDSSEPELLRPEPSRRLNSRTVPSLMCLSSRVVNHRRRHVRPGDVPYAHMNSGVVIYCPPVTDLGQTTVLSFLTFCCQAPGAAQTLEPQSVTVIRLGCHHYRVRGKMRVDHVAPRGCLSPSKSVVSLTHTSIRLGVFAACRPGDATNERRAQRGSLLSKQAHRSSVIFGLSLLSASYWPLREANPVNVSPSSHSDAMSRLFLCLWMTPIRVCVCTCHCMERP